MLEKRAGHDDRDDEDGNADYCSYSGKGGELIVCDGCVAAFREQLLEKWQRTKALTMDDELWYCGMCVEKVWHAIRFTPLGTDKGGASYWFVGGHFFWHEPRTDLWAYLTVAEVEARVEAWKPAGRGQTSPLLAAFQDHLPRLHPEEISATLVESFTELAAGDGDALSVEAVEGSPRAPAAPAEPADPAGPLTFANVLVREEYDCLDDSPGWFTAQIVNKTADRLQIHFKGWSKRHDIWIDDDMVPARVAALGSRAGTELTDADREALKPKPKPQKEPESKEETMSEAEVSGAAGGDDEAVEMDEDVAPDAADAAPPIGFTWDSIKSGTVDKMEDGKLPPLATKPTQLLPDCDELRTWTLESQKALWQQRLQFWKKHKLSACQVACRQRSLWIGGSAEQLRTRLRQFEFDATLLQGDEVVTPQEQRRQDAVLDMPVFRNHYTRLGHDRSAYLFDKFYIAPESVWPGRRKTGYAMEPETLLEHSVSTLLKMEDKIQSIMDAALWRRCRYEWTARVKHCDSPRGFVALLLQFEAAIEHKWFYDSWRAGSGCLHDGHSPTDDGPFEVIETDGDEKKKGSWKLSKNKRESVSARRKKEDGVIEMKSRKYSKKKSYDECKFISSGGTPVTIRFSTHRDPLLSLRDLMVAIYDDDDASRATSRIQMAKPKLSGELRNHRFAQWGKSSPAVPLSKLQSALTNIGEAETIAFLNSGDVGRLQVLLGGEGTDPTPANADLASAGPVDIVPKASPGPLDMDEDADVENIMDKGTDKDGAVRYLVRWEGKGASDDTWELEADLIHSSADKIKLFERKKKRLHDRRSERQARDRKKEAHWIFQSAALSEEDHTMYRALPATDAGTTEVAADGGVPDSAASPLRRRRSDEDIADFLWVAKERTGAWSRPDTQRRESSTRKRCAKNPCVPVDGFVYDESVAWVNMREAWIWQVSRASSLVQIAMYAKILFCVIQWADVNRAISERIQQERDDRTQRGIEASCRFAIRQMIKQIEDAAEKKARLQNSLRAVFDAISSKKRGDREQSLAFRQLPSRDESPQFYAKVATPISLAEIDAKIQGEEYDSAAALESDMTLMFNNAKVVWETDSETYADAQSLAETLSEVMQAVNEGEGGLYRYHRKVADPRHMTDEQARMLLEWWEAYAAENSPWQEVSTAQRLELADKIGLQVKSVNYFLWEKRQDARDGVGGSGAGPDTAAAHAVSEAAPLKVERTTEEKGLAICSRAMKVLWDERDPDSGFGESFVPGRQIAAAFRTLPSRSENPDFYTAVAEPLCLEQVTEKIRSAIYKNLESFDSDVVHVFTSFQRYYTPESVEGKDAQRMLVLFDTKMKKYRSEARGIGFAAPITSVLRRQCIDEVCDRLRGAIDTSSRRPRERLSSFTLPDRVKHKEYYEKVPHPIDVPTITAKVAKKGYKLWLPFAMDVQRLFDNAFMYYAPGVAVYEDAEVLERIFHEYEATLPEAVKKESGDEVYITRAELQQKRCEEMKATLAVACAVKDGQGNEIGPQLSTLADPGLEDDGGPEVSLAAIKQRIDGRAYRVWASFERDLLALCDKARRTAGIGSAVAQHANALEAAYRERARAVPQDLLGGKLFKAKLSKPRPVGPGKVSRHQEMISTIELLQKVQDGDRLASTSFMELPPQETCAAFYASVAGPVSLRLMEEKAAKFSYKKWENFAKDVRRMLREGRNFLYPPGSVGSLDAALLEKVFDSREAKVPAAIREGAASAAVVPAAAPASAAPAAPPAATPAAPMPNAPPVAAGNAAAASPPTADAASAGAAAPGAPPAPAPVLGAAGPKIKTVSIKVQKREAILGAWERMRDLRDSDGNEVAASFWQLPSADNTAYFAKVAEPMSLVQVRDRLDIGKRPGGAAAGASVYASWPEFEADVDKIFRNAAAYFGPDSPQHKHAELMRVAFDDFRGKLSDEVKAAKPAARAPRASAGKQHQKLREQAMLAALAHLESLRDSNGRSILESITAFVLTVNASGQSAQPMPTLVDIKKRVATSQYQQWETFARDVTIVLTNVRNISQPDSQVCADAAGLEQAFRKYAESVPEDAKAAAPAARNAAASMGGAEFFRRNVVPAMEATIDFIQRLTDEQGRPIAAGLMQLPTREQDPQYYASVQHPVSIVLVAQNIQKGVYQSWLAFEADILTMLSNARQYHSQVAQHSGLPVPQIVNDAERVQASYSAYVAKHISQAVKQGPPPKPKRKSQKETRTEYMLQCWQAMYGLKDSAGRMIAAAFFRLPDPQQYPQFHQVPKPMSLEILRANIDQGVYNNWTAFRTDVAALFQNAQQLYPPESQVNQDGKVMVSAFMQAEQHVPSSLTQPKQPAPAHPPQHPPQHYGPPSEPPPQQQHPQQQVGHYGQGPQQAAAAAPPAAPPLSQLRQQAMLNALNVLFKATDGSQPPRRVCEMFEQLPDPQQFPDYYQFIKKPIALHEIAEKASQNLYRSWQDFEGDVLLVFANAQTYNMPDSLIAQDAAGLEHAFRGFCQALPPEVVGAGPGPVPAKSKKRASSGGARAAKKDKKAKESARLTRKQGIIAVLDHLTQVTDGGGRALCPIFLDLPDHNLFPDYYEIIKAPVCLNDMRKRATANQYTRWPTFENELLRMFSNARTYNQEGSEVYQNADALEAAYRSFVQRLPAEVTVHSVVVAAAAKPKAAGKRKARGSTSAAAAAAGGKSEQQAMLRIFGNVNNLWSKDGLGKDDQGRAAIFTTLPSSAEYPDYYDLIKRPIDLTMIGDRLAQGAYASMGDFAADMNLLFENALRYNLPESQVAQDALFLQKRVNDSIAHSGQGGKKRRTSGDAKR